MPDDVDNFSGGVWIVNLTIIRHGPQLREGLHNPPHDVLGNIVQGAVPLVHIIHLAVTPL